MKTKELERQLEHIENANICEHCCRMLVVPKYKLFEHLQDCTHMAGEVMLMVGKFFASIFIGVQFLIEAIFPHLSRQKTPYELEYERVQKEWEDKREADAQADLDQRMRSDINEEAMYINSLKVRYRHPKDSYFDAAISNAHNRIVDDVNQSGTQNPELDRPHLFIHIVVERRLFRKMRVPGTFCAFSSIENLFFRVFLADLRHFRR